MEGKSTLNASPTSLFANEADATTANEPATTTTKATAKSNANRSGMEIFWTLLSIMTSISIV